MASFACKPACVAHRARGAVVVRAQQEPVDRRQALAAVVGGVGMSAALPSLAAYGEPARIFAKSGKPTTALKPFSGDGFTMLLPRQWEESKEVEYPGQIARYEDHFDVLSNLLIVKQPVGASTIEGIGTPEQFIKKYQDLFGRQTWVSEDYESGEFATGKSAQLHIIDSSKGTSKDGRVYYDIQTLMRTADDNEGGRHSLLRAGVTNGKLIIVKVQAGDKRWVRGFRNLVRDTRNSVVIG